MNAVMPRWIGLDWGSSNLRIYALDIDGEHLDENSSAKGMGVLKPEQIKPTALELIGSWLDVGRVEPVIACSNSLVFITSSCRNRNILPIKAGGPATSNIPIKKLLCAPFFSKRGKAGQILTLAIDQHAL